MSSRCVVAAVSWSDSDSSQARYSGLPITTTCSRAGTSARTLSIAARNISWQTSAFAWLSTSMSRNSSAVSMVLRLSATAPILIVPKWVATHSTESGASRATVSPNPMPSFLSALPVRFDSAASSP